MSDTGKLDKVLSLTHSIDKKVAVIEVDLRQHKEGVVQNRKALQLLEKAVEALEDKRAEEEAIKALKIQQRAKLGWMVAIVGGAITALAKLLEFL